jgi:hypothetical protein
VCRSQCRPLTRPLTTGRCAQQTSTCHFTTPPPLTHTNIGCMLHVCVVPTQTRPTHVCVVPTQTRPTHVCVVPTQTRPTHDNTHAGLRTSAHHPGPHPHTRTSPYAVLHQFCSAACLASPSALSCASDRLVGGASDASGAGGTYSFTCVGGGVAQVLHCELRQWLQSGNAKGSGASVCWGRLHRSKCVWVGGGHTCVKGRTHM